jgi:hypothetical protein
VEGWSKDVVVGIHHHDGVEVGVGPRSEEGSKVLIECGEGFSEVLREMLGGSKMGVGGIRAIAVTGAIADEDAKAVALFPLEMDPIPPSEMIREGFLDAMGSVVDREGKGTADQVATSGVVSTGVEKERMSVVEVFPSASKLVGNPGGRGNFGPEVCVGFSKAKHV